MQNNMKITIFKYFIPFPRFWLQMLPTPWFKKIAINRASIY